MATGSCLCGTVMWETDAPFTQMTHCHCSMCRKAHGAPFATYLSAPPEGFRWLSGETAIRDYESSPGFVRRFCSTCGSVVAAPRYDGVAIPAGSMDDDPGIRPSGHNFVADRAPWHTIWDELPQSAGYSSEDAPAPVERPDPGPAKPGVLRGSCLCGDVAYEARAPFETIYNCHCRSCRRGKAAAYTTNGLISGVVVTRGEDKLASYRGSFCRNCGSWMPTSGSLYVSLGSLDDDPGEGPANHIYAFEKAAWFEISDGLPSDGDGPLLGMLVNAHCGAAEPDADSEMQVNWDGTIQMSGMWRWRALVLGVDDRGQVILTNCMNTEQRLQLCMGAGRSPITGLRAPASAAIPLCLAGQHADQALVLSETKREYFGIDQEHVIVGPQEEALCVHVEPDGVIRLADRPQQAFDCESGGTSIGTKVAIFHNNCFDQQKFVLNEGATLSPIGNRDAVWGMCGEELMLVGKDDERADRLTFTEKFAIAARVKGPGTLVEGEPPVCHEGYVLELESHPGMALSVGPYEDRDDVKRLVLVSIAAAERFIVAADHLRLVDGGAKIALGTPVLPT